MSIALRVFYALVAAVVLAGAVLMGYGYGVTDNLYRGPHITQPSTPPAISETGPVACSADGQEDGQLVNCNDFKPLDWNGEAWYTK